MTQRLVTVDAETYYDTASKYDIRSLGSTQYIRDPRFQEIGWGVRDVPARTGDALYPTQWHNGRDWQSMHDWLVSFDMARAGTYVVTQNGAGFDFLILAWKHGIVPWMCLDTLQMSRVLYGIKGPGGKGNSLKALAEFFEVGAKGTEVILANGMRLEDFNAATLAQYGRYCANDVDLTEAVARRLVKQFTPMELQMMSLVSKMSARARLEVDVEMCEQALAKHLAERRDMLADVARDLGVDKKDLQSALMSNPKFARLLEELGVEPPMKISKTTGKPTYAFAKTDPEMQEMIDSDDELVADVVRLRTGIKSTLMATRLQHFINVGRSGPMPAGLRYGGAHTGRAAADGGVHKCQLHNLPSRGKEGKRNALRMSLVAPEGSIVCGADASQIEVRVMAANAGQSSLLQAFAQRDDPYLNPALCVPLFGRQITKEHDKPLRDITKAAVLAAQFAQGAKGFLSHCKRNGIDISPEMAERTIGAYRRAHPEIVAFWRDCTTAIKAMAGMRPAFAFGANEKIVAEKGWLTLPSGRRMEYRDIEAAQNDETGFMEFSFYEKHSGMRKYIYGGRLAENITQAVAYDVVAYQATMLEDALGDVPVLFTHDELVYVCPEREASRYRNAIEDAMTTRPKWLSPVRLECEFSRGHCYADI